MVVVAKPLAAAAPWGTVEFVVPVPAVFDAIAFGVNVLLGETGKVVVGPWPAKVSAEGCFLKPSMLAPGTDMPVLQPTELSTARAQPLMTSR